MGPDKRQFPRGKKRSACEFELDGHLCNGIISDFSARGLFINSTKQPAPGSAIEIVLRDAAVGEIALRCRVARLLKSHGSAAAVMPAGFGVEIDYAPEPYYEMLVSMGLG